MTWFRRLLPLALLLCGCRMAAPHAVTPSYPDLPVARLSYSDHVEETSLRANYGYVIDWPTGSQPTFYVFDRSRGLRLRTRSWTAFLVALTAFPHGSDVDAVSKCSVPFAAGMPLDHADVLDAVIVGKHLHPLGPSDPQHVELCTCETKSCDLLFDVEK
jgi:hypothetical protein